MQRSHLHTAALRAGEGQEVGAKTEMKGPVKEGQTNQRPTQLLTSLTPHTLPKQSSTGCCQREPTKGLFTDVPSLFTAQINRRGAHSSYLIKAAKNTKTKKQNKKPGGFSVTAVSNCTGQQLWLSFPLLCRLAGEAEILVSV